MPKTKSLIPRKRNRIPTVAECLERIVADVERRRPIAAAAVSGPNANGRILPIFILRDKGKRNCISAPFHLPHSRKNLQYNVLEIPGAYVVAKTKGGFSIEFPKARTPNPYLGRQGKREGIRDETTASTVSARQDGI